MAARFYIHIGLHKTGSTFLQKQVFPKHPEILYLGKPWLNEDIKLMSDHILFSESFDMSDHLADVAKLIRSSPHQVVLLSQESFSAGADWWGRYWRQTALRLRQSFPDANIIVTMRDLTAFLDSLHRNAVYHGYKQSRADFLESDDAEYVRERLSGLLKYYRELFGEDHVCELSHERLRADPDAELERLWAFMGVSGVDFENAQMNVGTSPRAVPLLLALNRILADDWSVQYRMVATGSFTLKARIRTQLAKLIRAHYAPVAVNEAAV